MLELAKLVFQILSLCLLVLLLWQPRYPVFMVAVLFGVLRSWFSDPSDAVLYVAWDAPTTFLRLAACVEAFVLRTEGLTKRKTIALLCLATAGFLVAILWNVPVDETSIHHYNRAAMLGYYGAAAFLFPLTLYGLWLPVIYTRDQAHVILLAALCLLFACHDVIAVPWKGLWESAAVTVHWITSLLLVGWLVCFGHPLVTSGLFEFLLQQIRSLFQRR